MECQGLCEPFYHTRMPDTSPRLPIYSYLYLCTGNQNSLVCDSCIFPAANTTSYLDSEGSQPLVCTTNPIPFTPVLAQYQLFVTLSYLVENTKSLSGERMAFVSLLETHQWNPLGQYKAPLCLLRRVVCFWKIVTRNSEGRFKCQKGSQLHFSTLKVYN
jgi:hypothetical protein